MSVENNVWNSPARLSPCLYSIRIYGVYDKPCYFRRWIFGVRVLLKLYAYYALEFFSDTKSYIAMKNRSLKYLFHRRFYYPNNWIFNLKLLHISLVIARLNKTVIEYYQKS